MGEGRQVEDTGQGAREVREMASSRRGGRRAKRALVVAVVTLTSLLLAGCSSAHTRKGGAIERQPPISAEDAEAQAAFDKALADLEGGRYQEAGQALRLLQAEHPDDPIAPVAELYVLRAALGPLEGLSPGSSEATAREQALGRLGALAESEEVDARIRWAAWIYAAILEATLGRREAAVQRLSDYPGPQLSPAVLAADRLGARAILVEGLHAADRQRDALEAAGKLHEEVQRELQARGTQTAEVTSEAAPELEALAAYALGRGFDAAARVPEDQLEDLSRADDAFVRALAGWMLIEGALPERRGQDLGEERRQALEDLFNRISPDLVAVGATERGRGALAAVSPGGHAPQAGAGGAGAAVGAQRGRGPAGDAGDAAGAAGLPSLGQPAAHAGLPR